MQPSHFGNKTLHDNQRRNGQQYRVVLDIVQFEHDKAFVQQVDVLFRVEQVIVFAALIVGFQDVQEILDVEILFPDTLAFGAIRDTLCR